MADDKENTGGKDPLDSKGAENSQGKSSTELDVEGLDIEETLAEDAVEEKKEDAQKETPQKKKRGKREYIVISVSLFLVLCIVGGGVFVWTHYFASDKGSALSSSRGYMYELKPFFVPLSKAEPKKFLRVSMQLQLSDKSSSKQIVKRLEEVRGSILSILINAFPKNIESSQGKKELGEEITSAINLLLGKNILRGISFNDVLVV